MSEATLEGLDDLFTPELTPSDPPPVSDLGPLTPIPSSPDDGWRPPILVPYVQPPTLSPRTKSRYKSLPPEFVPLGIEFESAEIDKVVGEYQQGPDLYYFVKFQDGISHKMHSSLVITKFGDFVERYYQEKKAGTLEPFSPESTAVHPNSRIKLSITLPPPKKPITSYARDKRKNPGPRGRATQETISDSEEEPASQEDGSSADEGDWGRPARKSSRSRKTTVKPLPFSPRKTRAKKGFMLPESEGDDDIVEVPPPTRKSTRSTKGVSKYQDAEDYEDDESSEDEIGIGMSSSRRSRGNTAHKAKKKPARGQASRPAYGNVRAVDDLAGDALSDEETAPLRAHRDVCEKCHRGHAAQLIKAENKRKGKRRGSEDDEDEGTVLEQLERLGGWVRCLKCPVVAHWGCLASTQQDEIRKAIQVKDRIQAEANRDPADTDPIVVRRRDKLTTDQTTEFICGSCLKGGFCMGCMQIALVPDSRMDPKPPTPATEVDGDAQMLDGTKPAIEMDVATPKELLFRCFTCKRLAHYEHLPVPTEYNDQSVDSTLLAEHYQSSTGWKCADCASFTFQLDKILAWRPYPPNATETSPLEGRSHTQNLPREYLVKWLDKSYRRTQWVPHMWLSSTHAAKLKNFLSVGPKVELLLSAVPDENSLAETGETGDVEVAPFEIVVDSEQTGNKVAAVNVSPLDPAPDAERRIPLPWKTIDRVLDVVLLPGPRKGAKNKQKGRKRAVSSDEEEDPADEIEAEIQSIFVDGEQPADHLTETVAEWEGRTGRDLSAADIRHVIWAFIKWDDLSYEEATWDSPPRPGKFGYAAFETAFIRFVESRKVKVPKKALLNIKDRPTGLYKKKYALNREKGEQPLLGQDKALTLMPFQIDGFNWLCDNWWRLQHCILADEMGLGKTVQIVTFLGTIMERWKAFPALVVVPNSTITNWVREFEKWAPNLRVVPFYGEAKSRAIIKKFELEHETKETGFLRAKFHVLVTTYETLTNTKDFTPVFKSVPRWEVLVVDEGQRLKSDSSLLFKKLNELRTEHRIIMTGTPLNNNMRELFNLMNFLDPEEWRDLDALQHEHEILTEELVKQLHERLRPYFLRRIKSEVLQLPPKNEVIVPVSMAPLQKEVYRSILSKNFTVLKSLTTTKLQSSGGKLNNILMQLRKCLQHPYLIDEGIEPHGLASQEAHLKLIDASAKLRLLKILLPQLRARGHRVLLFSQFVIALDFIEDFLGGEGMKYLRLDGNTKQADRQKGMDTFNKPGSDVFIYILSTRAGGVGINLWSADTVIIFDPDFNPHQDLQAIARAYRYGQKKTCLVFKLMVKDSAEERIMQTGKKKLVLDHLIVQKMDDDDSAGDDVQSILTYGAKALFEEGDQGIHDIIYSENDIEKLIEKTETEGDQADTEKKDGAFSFAKIWTAEKDNFEEMPDEPTDNNDADDAWAQTLARIAAENVKIEAQEKTGRGVRRKAAPQVMTIDMRDTPEKGKGKNKSYKSKSNVSDESDGYAGSAIDGSALNGSDGDDSDSAYVAAQELRALAQNPEKKRKTPTNNENHASTSRQPAPIPEQPDDTDLCSMCGLDHQGTECYMTASSEHLVEYRKILMDPECGPIEPRQAAIAVIDETLFKRGKMHLIDGQPLHLLEINIPVPKPPKRGNPGAAVVGSSFPLNGSMAGSLASSSKRTSSPVQMEEPSVKKAKVSSNLAPCIICGLSPFHLVKDCPTVAQGPASIANIIKRFQDDPTQAHNVAVLTKILKKQKKQEAMVISD